MSHSHCFSCGSISILVRSAVNQDSCSSRMLAKTGFSFFFGLEVILVNETQFYKPETLSWLNIIDNFHNEVIIFNINFIFTRIVLFYLYSSLKCKKISQNNYRRVDVFEMKERKHGREAVVNVRYDWLPCDLDEARTKLCLFVVRHLIGSRANRAHRDK